MNPWYVAVVVVGALAVSVAAGSFLTGVVLRIASHSPDAGPQVPPAPPVLPAPQAGPAGTLPRAALRGGTWIGLLERLAITGALLAGYPAAIAFVIAVKGLGRYPELREHPEESERFVIGTLASMAWAAAVGVAGLALLGSTIISN